MPPISQSALHPGRGLPPPNARNPYEGNAWALREGKRLYQWFNCSGCHFAGSGGIGPALMDDRWIYGSEPGNIFATIVEGRPNGMPSFRGRITEEQVWMIVAYVRSLGELPRAGDEPGRSRDDTRTQGTGQERSPPSNRK